jgi:hypothetical protein
MKRIFIKNVSCLWWEVFVDQSSSQVGREMWQIFAHDEEVETELRKWLTQQSKDFNSGRFNALVKGWVKCISVGGGYVEK